MLLELIGIGRKRVERITERIGQERLDEAIAEADKYIALPLMQKLASPPEVASAGTSTGQKPTANNPGADPANRSGTSGENPANDPAEVSDAAAMMVDGGMFQHTDVNEDSRAERPTHWNEYKSGIALKLEPRADGIEPGPDAPDPCPEPPECILDVGFGARIAKEVGRKQAATDAKTASAEARSEDAANEGVDLDGVKTVADLEQRIAESAARADGQQDGQQDGKSDRAASAALSPKVARREVVATFEKGHKIGELLAARAWQRGLFQAKFKAFVGDGSGWITTIFERFFKPFGFVSVLDLVHAISYVYSSAVAGRTEEEGGRIYREWMTWIWQGEVSRVISALESRSLELGEPQEDDGESEPRVVVWAALRYLRNQSSRMNYPEYRKCGLPLTSSLMESTVKELNYRIKGSEKFWSTSGGSGVLQLKADTLSDSKPLDDFWDRRQETRTGFRKNVGKRASRSAPSTTA